MTTTGSWIGAADSIKGYKGMPTTARRARGGRTAAAGYGSYNTSEIIGIQTVADKVGSNERDASRLLAQGGDQLDDNDRNFLEDIVARGTSIPGVRGGLEGLSKIMEFIQRPGALLNLFVADVLPSAVGATLVGGPFGWALKARDPNYRGSADFLKSADTLAQERGVGAEITGQDYWDVLMGRRQDVAERIGTTLAGQHGDLSFSSLIEGSGVTVKGLDSLPDGVRHLARAARFAGAFGGDFVVDPLNAYTWGTSGLGRNIAQKLATGAIGVAAKSARKMVLANGTSKVLRSSIRESAEQLEVKMADEVLDTIRAWEKTADKFKPGSTWEQKVDKVFDYEKTYKIKQDKTFKTTELYDLPTEGDFFFGSAKHSPVGRAVQEVAGEIEKRSYGRGLGPDSWWDAYTKYARTGAAPSGTTGGIRVGLWPWMAATKPGSIFQRAQFTIPKTRGLSLRKAATGRLGRPGLPKAGPARQWVERFGDTFRETVAPWLGRERGGRLISRKAYRTGVREGGYYPVYLSEEIGRPLLRELTGVRQIPHQISAMMGHAEATMRREVPEAQLNDSFTSFLRAVNNGEVWRPPDHMAISSGLIDEVNGFTRELSLIYRDLDTKMKIVNPDLNLKGINYRPIIESDDFKKVMELLHATYSGRIFPKDSKSWLLEDRETWAKQLTTASKEAGRDVEVTLADVDNWFKFYDAHGAKPAMPSSIGVTPQMRYRRAGRQTILIGHGSEEGFEIATGFVTVEDLNDSLIRTTQAVIDRAELPVRFKTEKVFTAKNLRLKQALELDPRKQVSQYLHDMTSMIEDRNRLYQFHRAGLIERGVTEIDQPGLKAFINENGLLDDLKLGAEQTRMTVSAQFDIAQEGPELIKRRVGGETWDVPVKLDKDLEFRGLVTSLNQHWDEFVSGSEIDYLTAYRHRVNELTQAGMPHGAAAAQAYAEAQAPMVSRETFHARMLSILERKAGQVQEAGVQLGDTPGEAAARTNRILAKDMERMSRQYEKLENAYRTAITGEDAANVEAISILDSDQGIWAKRAAEKRREAIAKAYGNAAETSITLAADDGVEAVIHRQQADIFDFLAEWMAGGGGEAMPYKRGKVEFSVGAGGGTGTRTVEEVVEDSDTVIALFHWSWVENFALDTGFAIKRIVDPSAKGRITPGWWGSNMLQLREGVFVPRQPTAKKLVAIMYSDETQAALQGPVIRRFIGDTGNIGVIGPPTVVTPASKYIVKPSTAMQARFGDRVQAVTVTELAEQLNVSEAALIAANETKIKSWVASAPSFRAEAEQAISGEVAPFQPSAFREYGSTASPRPKVSDFAEEADFLDALKQWSLERQTKRAAGTDPARFMRAISPYWEMDPDVLTSFDQVMTRLNNLMAEGGDVDPVLDQAWDAIEEFGVRYGFNEQDMTVLYNDWIELNWNTTTFELQKHYQDAHLHGANPRDWANTVESFSAKNNGVDYGNFAETIRIQNDNRINNRGMFDDAGFEMPVERKKTGRGSGPNTLRSASGDRDFLYIDAGQTIDVPERRYAPGVAVREQYKAQRPREINPVNTPEAEGPRAQGITTQQPGQGRLGEIEGAGTAIPPLEKGAAEQALGERLTKKIEPEVEKIVVPHYPRPIRGPRETDEFFNERLSAWAQKEQVAQSQIDVIGTDEYQTMAALVQEILTGRDTVKDRVTALASKQAVEQLDGVVLALEPLLDDKAFLALLYQQRLRMADISAVIQRFRISGSFYSVQDSKILETFIATALHFQDPEQIKTLARAKARHGLEKRTVPEIRKIAAELGVRRYSKLKKADLIELVNGALGDPTGPAVIRPVRPLTTVVPVGAKGINVGRASSGGRLGSRTKREFGNQWKPVGEDTTEVVAKYRKWLDAETSVQGGKRTWAYREDVADLAGQTLRCPKQKPHTPCHATYLAQKADELSKLPYEVSSAGDSRFSAFHATLSDGRTIETHYQVDVKGYPTWREGKDKPPLTDLTDAQTKAAYLQLWAEWADANPELLVELHQLTVARGRALSDRFAREGRANQAEALTQILEARFPKNVEMDEVLLRQRQQERQVPGNIDRPDAPAFEPPPPRLEPVASLAGVSDRDLAVAWEDAQTSIDAITNGRPEDLDLLLADAKVRVIEAGKQFDYWEDIRGARTELGAAEQEANFRQADAFLRESEEIQINLETAVADRDTYGAEVAYRAAAGAQEVPGQAQFGAAPPRPPEPAVVDPRVTPENITELEPHQVFVFGSNIRGRHGAGAAKTAADRFGAEAGVGRGITGQSYALPTKTASMKTFPIRNVELYYREFLEYAAEHPDQEFLLTKIGTGLAGIDETEMLEMVGSHPAPGNVVFPPGWKPTEESLGKRLDQLTTEREAMSERLLGQQVDTATLSDKDKADLIALQRDEYYGQVNPLEEESGISEAQGLNMEGLDEEIADIEAGIAALREEPASPAEITEILEGIEVVDTPLEELIEPMPAAVDVGAERPMREGPVMATTHGHSGLQDGPDMWAAEVFEEKGIPMTAHVPAVDYAKHEARFGASVVKPSAADQTGTWAQQAVRRTMANVDAADVTVVFSPPLKPGSRSIGTPKTIGYALNGEWPPGAPLSYGDHFVQTSPDSHVWVVGDGTRRSPVIVTGPPTPEGLETLRTLLIGKVNVAGPRPKFIVDPKGTEGWVKNTLRETLPGFPEMPGVATRPFDEAMGARKDQAREIIDTIKATAERKVMEMSSITRRFDIMAGADRLPRLKELAQAVNDDIGNLGKLRTFERWWGENSAAVNELVQGQYGPGYRVKIKRADNRIIPVVEHPRAEKTARRQLGKEFNELVNQVVDGSLSKDEALARGLDTVVVAADIRTKIQGASATSAADQIVPTSPEVTTALNDYANLAKLIDEATQTGQSRKLRAYIGITRLGEIDASPAWKRITAALDTHPETMDQLKRWVEAAWVADTPWSSEDAFLRWWMNERSLLSSRVFTMEQLRAQAMRRVGEATSEFGEVFGTRQRYEDIDKVLERLVTEINHLSPPGQSRAGVPIDVGFNRGALMEPLYEDANRTRLWAGSAAAEGVQLRASDSLKNISEMYRNMGSDPNFQHINRILPSGDEISPQAYYTNIADRIDQALSDPSFKTRMPTGLQTAESLGIETGILAGLDIDPLVAPLFVESTQNLRKVFTPYGMSIIGQSLHTMQNLWKRWATVVRPAFHIRNVIGGAANGFFAGIMPWDYAVWGSQTMKFRKGLKELQRGQFDLAEMGTRGQAFDNIALKYVDEPYRQAFRDAWSENVIQTGFSRAEGLAVSVQDGTSWNPLDPDFKGYSLGGRTMESLEDVMRMSMYGKFHAQGRPKFGKQMVNMLHFDYANLSSAEEQIKKFIPFFVWTRNNVPLQFRLLTEAPGFVLMTDHLRKNWNETQRLNHEDRWGPDSDTSGWLLPFGYRSDDDTWAQMMWQPDLPIMDLDRFPLWSSGEGPFPIGFGSFNISNIANYGSDLLGPAFSLPFEFQELGQEGSRNAPRGLAEIMQVGDLITNQIPGTQGFIKTGHDSAGNPTDVQVPKWADHLWHTALPFAEDYLAGLGFAPRNPYRAADEGWINSDEPGGGPFGIGSSDPLGQWGRGLGRTIGRGVGLKWDSSRSAFFDYQDEANRIANIEYQWKRGVGD